MEIYQKLQDLEHHFVQLESKLSDPSLANEQDRFRKLSKERSDMEEIVSTFRHYKDVITQHKGNIEILEQEKDEELRSMVKEDLASLEKEKAELEEKLKVLLLPKDPLDERNIIVEIRAGAGGDEAGLFAAELFRMYQKYAESRRWQVNIMSLTEVSPGNYREVSAEILGDRVYSTLRFESGVHRVQRVPQTEANGRIHTSTITVAIMPEVDDVEIVIKPEDVRVDTMRSGGAGGQHVNTTSSAVRLTHAPSGLVVICQDQRSQHKNKEKAFKVLRARLYDKALQEHNDKIASTRKLQVGSGDRSEKIRTYNFPQNRVTDHRIGYTSHNLPAFMEGDISEMITHLINFNQLELLKESGIT